MKKNLPLSVLGLIAALSLSACTGGASHDATSEPSSTSAPAVTTEVKSAAEALQSFLVSLDTEADTKTPTDSYGNIKSTFAQSSAKVADDIPQDHAVSMYKEYVKNLKQTPAGDAITVAPDGLVADASGNVAIKSSAIRIAFGGKFGDKPRIVDAKGKDTFILKKENGTWKIADATIG